MAVRFYLFFLLHILSFTNLNGQMVVGQDTLVGNEWINYGQRYYKFSVDADGIYRIPLETLAAAGIAEQAVGSRIRLFSMGIQVPIYVSTEDVFGAGDFIEFYGYKNRGEMDRYLFQRPDDDMLNPDHSLYTDKREYYLTFNETDPPARVTSLANDISNPPVQESFYIHKEIVNYNTAFNDPYYPISGGGAVSYSSYLHSEGFCKNSENNTTIQIAALNKASTGPDAILHVRMASTNIGVHEFELAFNTHVLDTLEVRDLKILDTFYVVPLALLQENNQMTILSLNALSRQALVKVELSYPHTLSLNGASESVIYIQNNPVDQYYVFDAFSHGGVSPIVYSTDGTARMEADINALQLVHWVWPGQSEETGLRMVDPAAGIRIIAALEQKDFTDFATDDTEYIVITHPDLMEIGTGSEYTQYRSSQAGGSYKAKAYSILDLYDQFGYGIEKHPQSIRNFVEFFNRHWPSAKMIFIIGRGIEYNRSRYTGGGWESSFFVPTFGRPGSDNLLVATTWDLVPRYPIGRLACINASGIQLYLDKVKEYDAYSTAEQTIEGKAWMKRVIHITGGQNASEQNSFKQTLNLLGDELTQSDFGAHVSFFQKESTDIIGESTSKQIEKLLHEGSAIINYLGHSSTSTFEFTINDPAEWNNKGRYPIFSAMGCSAGQIHSTVFSLSDRYVQIRDEGSIAFISGSGSQFPSALISWARPWYDYFGNVEYGATLGESVLYGLRALGNFVDLQLTGSNSYRYLLEQQTFQGDPALRIFPLPGPDYLIDRSSVVIAPDILNTKQDSFDLTFSILNLGRNLRQLVDYKVRIRSQEGVEWELKQDATICGEYATEVSERIPLTPGLKAGSYRLLIDLDPAHVIEELPLEEAELNNSLEDNLGVEGIQLILLDNLIKAVYPQDFAIVNTNPELVVTGSNSFLKGQVIVMELDTTPFFNSPLRVRETFSDHSTTLKWNPEINWLTDQVYYWRTSLDSISTDLGYNWSRRSFLYKPDSPLGWNQSEFYQLTDDGLERLVPDSLNRDFKFESAVNNFRILNRYQIPNAGGIPFGFIDNVYYTEFFSKFTNNDVHVFVVAVDPVTGAFMLNPNPGLYGSFNNLSYTIRCFPYRTDLPESRQALIHFVENIIPPDYLVFFYTYQRDARPDYYPDQWAADEVTFGKSIYSVIENQYPESAIRTLATTGSKPYIVLFQKNKGGIEEIIASDTSDVISMSYDIKGSLKQGKYVSTLIGPASRWHSIHWDMETPDVDTAGANVVSAWALSSDLTDTLWLSHHLIFPDILIEAIDADSYPYLQLAFSTQDSITYHPSGINYWRVLYDGYPELILHPDLGFEFIADTLIQGETMSLTTYVDNVSPYDIDTLPVSLRIISPDHTTEELSQDLINVKANSASWIRFEKPTHTFQGDYQVLMEVNPERAIPELNYNNNIGILPMHVIGDRVNPILYVTFDGYHIQDGDLVAAKPLIEIKLHDENTNLRLTDTSAFIIFLQYPSAFEPHRVYFSEPWVQFIAAPVNGENIATANLTPDLWEDGIYTLQVQARDASGNYSGDNDYLISFEVLHENSVSYIYNYPNPFSSSTRFVYILTGEGSPSFYKIEILSVTGIVVKEITQEELGPLAVGNHRTEYVWDGKDNNGNELAAGIYLYRLIVKDENGVDYTRYETYSNNTLFDNGWGKLILIR